MTVSVAFKINLKYLLPYLTKIFFPKIVPTNPLIIIKKISKKYSEYAKPTKPNTTTLIKCCIDINAECVARCLTGSRFSVFTIPATKVPDAPKNIVMKPENAPPIVICFDPIIGILPYTDHNINKDIDN